MNDIVERLRDFCLPDDEIITEGIEEIEALRKRTDLLDQENEKLSGEVAHWRNRALKAENSTCEHYSPERCGCLCEPRTKTEALAAYAHEAWSGWMKYMFDKCNIDGDSESWKYFRMPSGLFYRWQRQMNTEYHELPESEKKSDRREAENMIEVMCSRGKETYRNDDQI